MSEDEIAVLVVSALIATIAWAAWYASALRLASVYRGGAARRAYLLAPLAAAAPLLGVLLAWSSHDVHSSPTYVAFYLVLGAAWVGVLARLLPLFGLSARDDVLERRNPAAAGALTGALIGLSLCFAGGNIGDGPGWWVVVFCAALASAAWCAAWFALELAARVAERTTVERDAAAAARLAGFLVAAGLVLGRSVAGDWRGVEPTVADFARQAWPVAALVGLAALIERTLRTTPERPRGDPLLHGALPAAGFLALASLYVGTLGPWD